MDHLDWLMELQQADYPTQLPQLPKDTVFSAESAGEAALSEHTAAPRTEQGSFASKSDALTTLEAALEQLDRTRVLWKKERETVSVAKKSTTQTAAWEMRMGDIPALSDGGAELSMEEISRFFERDARRFG